MRWHNAAVLCALLAHGGAAMAQQVAAPGNPSAPAGAVAVDPNAIRVLLSPELETTLVSQMVGRIVTLNASLGARVVKGRTVVRIGADGKAGHHAAQPVVVLHRRAEPRRPV